MIFKHLFVALYLGKSHYANPGIRDNKAFSVCLDSEDMVEMTDYCGIGEKVAKAWNIGKKCKAKRK